MIIGVVVTNSRSVGDYISRQLLHRYLHPAVEIRFEIVVLLVGM